MVAYMFMDFKPYENIIFDFDETLATLIVDWKWWHTDIIPIIKKYEPDFDENSKLNMYNIHQFTNKYGKSFRDDYVNFEISLELKHYKTYKLIDKSFKLLQELHQQNKSLYLLTSNSREIVLPILKELKIEDYFVKTIMANDVENFKPSPAPFKLIASGETDHSQYLMVGDSINDREFAQNVGIDYLDVKDF